MSALKFFASLFLFPFLLAPAKAQYTVAPIGACDASGVSDAVKNVLEPNGYQVKDASGAPYAEVWLRKGIPSDKNAPSAGGADFTSIPLSTLIGVIRFDKDTNDFRGNKLRAGVYTMRYQLQPEDGNHQGASPRRDHLVLSLAADDTDPNANPNFDALIKQSEKASGINHPLVLFLALPDPSAKFPSIEHVSSRDMLDVQNGSLQLGITVAGKAEE